jgi:hypothetical protein
MNASTDVTDDIDKTIAEKLEELRKMERVPVGLKARVMRHYDQIRYANKILGWSYARITTDVLRPAGMLISPNTLRIYMEDLAKQHDSKRVKGKRNARSIPDSILTDTTNDIGNTTPAPSESDDEETLRLQQRDVEEADSRSQNDATERAKDEHAGMRRARART